MLCRIVFFILLVIVLLNAKKLNWASLDETHETLKGRAILYGSVSGINDTQLDPNPNSTTSVRNRIQLTYQDEDNFWKGDTTGATIVTPIFSYLKAMNSITSNIQNFIRTVYQTVYAELDLSTCNSVNSPPEVILDSNLGLGPNNILLTANDLSILIPPHPCVIPQILIYPDGPTFTNLRRFMRDYKKFLLALDSYFECILLYNAYPSYTKGVNCLEEYYYGSQDAGANPAFFDLMSNKQDLSNTINNFIANPIPTDVTAIVSTTWTQLQYELDIARQYKEIARKVRSFSQLLYTALTRNYARLERVKYCRTIEAQKYSTGLITRKYWCDYTTCVVSGFSFYLAGNIYNAPSPLMPQTIETCQTSTCPVTSSYPDPFYCDDLHACPSSMFCSLLDRHCYKIDQRREFTRSFNLTVCGIPRKTADTSIISGQVTSAFGGSANESSFWFKTFWPQNCTTVTTYLPDTHYVTSIGPVIFPEVCYSFIPGIDISQFFDNTTTDCSLLSNGTETFKNVSYTYYLDGIAIRYVLEDITVTRTSIGDLSWQLEHCRINGPEPIIFLDSNANYTICENITVQDFNCTFCLDPENNCTYCNDTIEVCSVFQVYTNLATYMKCPSGDPHCVTTNSTHACFHSVQDVTEIYTHFLTKNDIVCRDIHMHPPGVYNDTLSNGLSTPLPQTVPSGYTNSTYFKLNSFNFGSISGSYTVYPPLTNVTANNIADTITFNGYYFNYSVGSYSYKLCGRLSFHTQQGDFYVEGIDYFIFFVVSTPTGYYLPTQAIDNTTGALLYDPLTFDHPDPRYNDPNECYYVQITNTANIPMYLSPPISAARYKDYWMEGVQYTPLTENQVSSFYPCAAIFLRRVLYVENSQWIQSNSTDYTQGVANGDLRYVCERSLAMGATCSHFGIPMNSTTLTTILSTVNPPSDTIIFQL